METLKNLLQWCWMDCKNRHRLYPENNHTFSDWWDVAKPIIEKSSLRELKEKIKNQEAISELSNNERTEEDEQKASDLLKLQMLLNVLDELGVYAKWNGEYWTVEILKLLDKAFTAGRSNSSYEQFLKDSNIKDLP